MNFYLDRNSRLTLHDQISNQILDAIDRGILKPGDRLPAQRELSAGLNISRGTIQKAYEMLELKGVIQITKGSGSYVTKTREMNEGDRKEAAVKLIDELLDKLSGFNYTRSEIHEFIEMRMSCMERDNRAVRVAVIDCNPEALEIFKIQLSLINNIHFKTFILEDILKFSHPVQVFEDYDIIITTLTHYDEIGAIIYPLKERLFKAAVSPGRDTIINIAFIPKNSKIAIISKSIKFKEIMIRNLETLSIDIDIENIKHAFNTDKSSIKSFLRDMDFIIIPQSFRLEDMVPGESLRGFLQRGGKVIEFKYQIERGSLVYIEEQIENIIDNRQ